MLPLGWFSVANTCADPPCRYRLAFSFHATEFALTSSVLRRPVAVGACTNVRGVCLSENFWFGVWACPLPRISVTDLPRIDFAVFCGGQNYFEVTIERDGGVEGDVLEELTKFWRLVEEDRQPDLDASESFRGHLLKQIKRRAHVAATPDDIRILDRWRDVAVDMKRLKAEESKIKNVIAARLANADANRLTSDLGDITVGAPRKKTAWKAIAEQLSPLVTTLQLVEGELVALRTAADADDDRMFAVSPIVQRIDALRAQLCFVGELNNFSDVVARHTTHGDPVINRPRAWTKSVDNDGEEES